MRALALVLAAVLGLAAGGVSALAMAGLVGPGGFGARFDVDAGGWVSDWSIGDAAANPYVRARVARYGLLALRKSEAVYFTRAVDDEGRPLTERCDYRLSGGGQDALWWSVTLYDASSRLPMNDDGALSIDASAVDASAVGGAARWSAAVSPARPQSGLWISSRNAGAFDLTLRLYRPSAAVLATPADAVRPPRIERLSCRGDA